MWFRISILRIDKIILLTKGVNKIIFVSINAEAGIPSKCISELET